MPGLICFPREIVSGVSGVCLSAEVRVPSVFFSREAVLKLTNNAPFRASYGLLELSTPSARRGNVKADGGSHDYSELNPIGNSKAPQLQYSDDDDDDYDDDDGEQPAPEVPKGKEGWDGKYDGKKYIPARIKRR